MKETGENYELKISDVGRLQTMEVKESGTEDILRTVEIVVVIGIG